MSIEAVIPSSRLILCHPLLLLPPIPPSIRVFSPTEHLKMVKILYFILYVLPQFFKRENGAVVHVYHLRGAAAWLPVKFQ